MTTTDDSRSPGSATEQRRGGFLRTLASDYKAFASLVGLLIYGVVRVAYDAFYSRLGVFPEAVGLSETTILGRAVLYLALTVSVTAIFVGLWLLAVGTSLERRRATERQYLPWARLLLLTTLVFPLVAFVIVVAGPRLRSLLDANHLAYYCFQRCKFSALRPSEVELLRAIAQKPANAPRNYRFIDVGPEWLIVVSVALLVVAAVVGLIVTRRPGWTRAIVLPYSVVALIAVAAITTGLSAPHLIASSSDASQSSASFVDAHPSFVRWSVFVLLFSAIVATLLVALHPLVGNEPRRSPWMIASFVIVLPVLFGFFAPNVTLFIQEEGASTVAAAVALWAALFAVSFWLWPDLREGTLRGTAGLAIVVALIVSLTLYLAWERGLNLAKKAAMGDQILVRRFGLLSVRSSVVCLEPSVKGASVDLPHRPYVYLGEAGGTLVLYDFVTDLAREVPEAYPVRIPSSGIVVRVAHYNPQTFVRWDCAPNS